MHEIFLNGKHLLIDICFDFRDYDSAGKLFRTNTYFYGTNCLEKYYLNIASII